MDRIESVSQIGKLVRTKRKAMKLTQKDLAGLCNLGTRFVSELENGKKTLEIEKVLKVLTSVGISIDLSDRKVS